LLAEEGLYREMWRESNEELKENSEFGIQKNRRFFESV
jgi:hypothetical protein